MSRSRRKKKKRVGFDANRAYNDNACIDPTGSLLSIQGPLPAGPPPTERRSEQHGVPREYAKLAPREVPVLGPAESDSAVLFHIEESHARDLIQQGKLTFGPKITKNLRALRIVPPPPPQSDKAISLHHKGVGDPHARSTRDNVRGCWTIEAPYGKEPATFRNFRAIPSNLQNIFHQVLLDCLSEKPAA